MSAAALGQQGGSSGAGKVTAGLAAARQLLSNGHWEAAYYADLSGCISPTSAAFAILSGQLLLHLGAFLAAEAVYYPQQQTETSCAGLAAFGVPSESPDASLLLAWLSRNMAMPAGLVIRISNGPARKHCLACQPPAATLAEGVPRTVAAAASGNCTDMSVQAPRQHRMQERQTYYLCAFLQVSPQLQLIVCGDEPLKLQRVNTAEVQLPSLPYDAAMRLLLTTSRQVAWSTCLFWYHQTEE